MTTTSHARKAWLTNAKKLLLNLRGRPDSEHEMSFNRLASGGLILGCVLAFNPEPAAVPELIGYCIASVAVFVQILFDQTVRVSRRLAMMLGDLGLLSYVMHANGAYGAAFYFLYLFITFGNGFRFGIPYLHAAGLVSITGFGFVVWFTPYWHDMPILSIGLMCGLIVLPAYAGTLIKKLEKAKREAEAASRAKSYFLASVSHELRTPLTAIIGLGAHLQDSDLPWEQKGMAGTIVTAGRSLLALINQLLEFSRLGAKGITAEVKPFDLPALLVSVCELMKVAAEDKGLQINFHIDPRTPLSFNGDETHLRDVLTNLVSNSIKFTEKGTITISAEAAPSADGALMLRLTVSDTGIGIDPDSQEHIFESFRQADDTIIDRFGGTGLGLAICKQLTGLMGGDIGVNSTPGEGSHFWFTAKVTEASGPAHAPAQQSQLLLLSRDTALIEHCQTMLAGAELTVRPVSEIDVLATMVKQMATTIHAVLIDADELSAQQLSIASLTDRLGEQPGLVMASNGAERDPTNERQFVTTLDRNPSQEELIAALRIATAGKRWMAAGSGETRPIPPRVSKRILIADDNVMNQKVFSMILGRAGHVVETAHDGEAALDVMKDHNIDIVLMDVNMPVLNGIEATKLYRFTALGRRRIPIVGITADASAETAERCIEAGMDACIGKPVEADSLLQLIEDLCVDTIPPEIPLFDPTGTVTPLFPTGSPKPSPINAAKLDELEELGGKEFVAELLADYVNDSDTVIATLLEAVTDDDDTKFRSGSHALRSSAANIGAEKVAQICLHLQSITRAEFEVKGVAHLNTLRAELEQVRQAVRRIEAGNKRALG